MSDLAHALMIAAAAHAGQVDRAGQPYMLHIMRLVQRLDGEHERTVAALHDLLEDCDWTVEQLRAEGFAAEVVAAVERLTRRADEPYPTFIERLADDPLARAVKVADLEDNMDVRRLPALDPADLERLAKYHRAWRRLGGGALASG
jgi:(p)ppGpp synthase/HD superfamily hydrolase